MLVKVSIIAPVYNVEECIERCINSIINQTYKDFELLLIDDGSKDKSIDIAKNMLEKTNINYRIITQINSGVSAARNRGIEEASGDVSKTTFSKVNVSRAYTKTERERIFKLP